MVDLQNVAIVVSSCDAFSCCWEPFVFSLNKFWPDCPFPIYIISNEMDFTNKTIHCIKVGKDLHWASNLRKALESIDHEYILYLQEDYFIDKPVNTAFIQEMIADCIQGQIDYLRLTFPYFDKFKISGEKYADSPLSQRYSLCLQTALWKKSSLKKLLIEGYTGWDFEFKIKDYIVENNIPIKSRVILSSDSINYGISYVDGTAIRKGRWTRAGYAFLIENGFSELAKEKSREGRFLNLMMHTHSIMRPVAAIVVRLMNRYHINF